MWNHALTFDKGSQNSVFGMCCSLGEGRGCFPQLSRAAHLAPIHWGTAQGMALTTHLSLAQRLAMSRAIPHTPLVPVWHTMERPSLCYFWQMWLTLHRNRSIHDLIIVLPKDYCLRCHTCTFEDSNLRTSHLHFLPAWSNLMKHLKHHRYCKSLLELPNV